MKKTLIALTLAALPVASMAEVVLYGQIKGGVEVSKVKKVKGTVTNIVDYGSRIGFKGQEQLNNNLKAIWQLEQKVNIGGGNSSKEIGKDTVEEAAGFGTRDSFIGLESPAGTVKVGYMETPLKAVNGKLDQWEYSSPFAGLGVFTRGNDVNKRALGVNYTTPDFNGFTASAFVAPSDNQVKSPFKTDAMGHKMEDARVRDGALYGVSASYQQPNGGFFADVAGNFKKNGKRNQDMKDGDKKRNAYQALAQAGYNTDKFLVGVAYQQAKNVDNGNTLSVGVFEEGTLKGDLAVHNVQEVATSVAYNVNDALTLKGSAAYGFNLKDEAKEKIAGNGKYTQGIIGADYNLSKRTQVNSQIGYMQFGKGDMKYRGGTVGVGMKHKF